MCQSVETALRFPTVARLWRPYPAAVLYLLALALLSAFLLSPLASPPPSARFLRLEVLKSVSYQPPPLSRKPAAEIFLTSAGCAHAGQSTKGASLNFCNASNSC